MNISNIITILDKHNPNPSNGLTTEVFEYISRTTPLINVDLLIKTSNNQTLLSWRDDKYCGRGWHIPGRIIRYKETIETCIIKAMQNEIGFIMPYDKNILAINELINLEYTTRGHFISLLYKCYLPSIFKLINNKSDMTKGYLKLHDFCPDNLIPAQNIYRKFI